MAEGHDGERRWRRGLLAEWAAGVAIVVVLAVLAGVVGNGRREDALRAICLSNLKCRGLMLAMYTTDFNGYLPPASAWPEAVLKYKGNVQENICPKDNRSRDVLRAGGRPASYTMLSVYGGVRQDYIVQPAKRPLMFDGNAIFGGAEQAAFRHRKDSEPGLNVLYCDGHCKALARGPFEALPFTPAFKTTP